MIVPYLRHCAAAAQRLKQAASRLDKEVAAGRVTYEDVVPPEMRKALAAKPVEDQKRVSRAFGQQPAYKAPGDLAKHRALNQSLFNAQTKNPNMPRVEVFRDTSEAMVMPLLNSMSDKYSKVPVVIGMPENPGGALRDAGTLKVPAKKKSGPMPPPTSAPVDKTLNLSAIQHELGEVESLRSPRLQPHASHMGIEPILRENAALHGDAAAYNIMQAARSEHADDALVAKLHKQVGGTGSSPVQPGTRRARAMADRLEAAVPQLSERARSAMAYAQLHAGPEQVVSGLPEPLVAKLNAGGSRAAHRLLKTFARKGRL